MNPRLFSLNFKIVPVEQAVVSVMDRSFLYGDSVYEVVRTYRGSVPFLLDRHFQRLLRSADRIGLQVPFSLAQLNNHLADCFRVAKNADSYVRIVVSRGEDTRFSLLPVAGIQATTVLYVEEVPVFPATYYDQGIRVAMVSVRRNLRTALDPSIKTGNYMNNMMALMEANKTDAQEAIMLNAEGNVTEATTSNIFMVKNGIVLTPEAKSGLLEGVSRMLLKEIMIRESIPFEERAISKDEFLACDEAFISGTIKEVMPIAHIDGRRVGEGTPGNVTRRLMRLFQDEIDRIVSSR